MCNTLELQHGNQEATIYESGRSHRAHAKRVIIVLYLIQNGNKLCTMQCTVTSLHFVLSLSSALPHSVFIYPFSRFTQLTQTTNSCSVFSEFPHFQLQLVTIFTVNAILSMEINLLKFRLHENSSLTFKKFFFCTHCEIVYQNIFDFFTISSYSY